jgi:predicted DNA-binding protein with PD1-like motif
MRSQRIADGRERTFALVLDTGDELMETLQRFAAHEDLSAASFTAIGAFSDALLAWFDWEQREYRQFSVSEQVEVLTLAGDVALGPDEQPQVHAHVVCGRRGGLTLGGHVMEAHVRPTLEIVLREAPAHLRKRIDPVTGLPLIMPEA